jgi:hypothetical protein
MQMALEIVEPWGDDRADIRSEANTIAAINPTEESLCRLRSYLKIHERDQALSPAQLRQIMESQ